MIRRTFTDAAGVEWLVWAAYPSDDWPNCLPTSYGSGWLIFETAAGLKRRLAPIPGDWTDCPDDALARLCLEARPSRASPP